MTRLAMPDNVIDLLRGMVRIDSVNTAASGRPQAENQLRDWLEEVATGWGLAARRLPVPGQADQLLVTFETRADGPWLLFDSHLDTVAVAGMTVEPFGGVIDGDRLYGRGACDTKGTGAAMLWALRDYMRGDERSANIAILFSVDEEQAMTGMRSFVARDLPTLPMRFAAAVVGEPTSFHPVVAHNGCVRWTIAAAGRASHSSVPHEGRSAISAMVRIIDAIEAGYIPGLTASHPRTGPAVCSVNVIRGGSAINIIPDRCEIEVDRRLAPGETAAEATAGLRAILDTLGVEYAMGVDVEHPPFNDDANGGLAAAAQAVLREMGLPTMLVGAPFATHAAYLAAAGLPTLVLGPGDPHPAHTKDEWVSVSAIRRGVELYLRLMRSLG